MSETALNPEEIPEFTGNLEQLELDASAVALDGTAIAEAASKVDSTFRGLSSYYAAPEADQLFASTAPVATGGGVFEDDLTTIGGALAAYATEIRPIVNRFKQLRAEAEAFRTSIADDDKWREDGDLVEENNNRRSAVNQAFADFQAAERTCHNKIVALVGGTALKVTDGSKDKNQYGFRAEDLDGAKDLPWGDPVEESTPWYHIHEHAWEFGKGLVVDGVWGTLKGLWTLVNVTDWEAFSQAWTGLAKLATGIAITASPFGAAFWLAPEDKLPSWVRDSRTAMKETGKALVAWDQWGSNPARAAGATTFNVLTTVFTAGAGAGVAGAGKAGAISKAIAAAGKAGRIIDPMTYVFKAGATTGIKIGEVVAGLRMLTDGTYVRLADTNFQIIDQPARAGDLPPGVTRENSVPLKDPETGEIVYFKPEGATIHHLDGTVTPAAKEASAAERLAQAADRQGAPQMVSVGVRPADGIAQVGDGLGGTVRTGDTPVGAGVRAESGTSISGYADNGATGARMDLEAGSGGRGTSAGGLADNTTGGGSRDVGTGGTEDLGRGASGGHEPPVGGRGSGSEGGPLDDIGRAGDEGLDGADGPIGSGDDAAGTAQRGDGGDGNGFGAAERELTTAERRALQEEHVRLANEDPAWFKKHYDILGRRRPHIGQVDGVDLPQLTKGPDGRWISHHDLPSGPSETKLATKPLGRDTAPGEHLQTLDRRMSDRELLRDLLNAQREFKESPSAGNAEKLAKAQEEFSRQLGDTPPNSKISERLGDDAAALHGIPAGFNVVEEITLPKTPNGADMFDGAYRLDEDEILLTEHKSPGNDLDWRQGRSDPGDPDNPVLGDDGGASGMRVKQATLPYVRTILAEMTSRGGRDAELAQEFRRALRAGKLRFAVVKVRDPDASKYAGVDVTEMKLH
ncbi:hypothetical protein H9Y04_43335 [Streptomyces sp. TRM66268-LWL]|uniref:Uncharacterized protein n=1 Tax=Streptomyces polyasparticus TaxID=2767826 RepID=A0ABR7SXH5_9ACTN|nr:hypothetical protein [Streptomyces polyasparticus]MBC9719365.1 hypothetical protein [Streptomyces polyasparticus]